MEAQTFGYARVSTHEQNLDRQLDALRKAGVEERFIITEKASGKDTNRPQYTALRNTMLRSGDTLVIKSLDRLSRNKEDMKAELQYFKQNHIRVKIIDLPSTMVDMPDSQEWIIETINNVMIELLGAIAEQERKTIKQRQAEGIAVAKAQGRTLGRPKAVYPVEWDSVYSDWKQDKITATKAISLLSVSRTTFYKLVKEYENK